jgi:hypothetical protein
MKNGRQQNVRRRWGEGLSADWQLLAKRLRPLHHVNHNQSNIAEPPFFRPFNVILPIWK